MVAHLQSQRARQELLSMLYKVELHRHRETHQLFSAISSQLAQGEGKENHIQEKVYTKGSWYSCQRLCAKTLLERVNENVEFP